MNKSNHSFQLSQTSKKRPPTRIKTQTSKSPITLQEDAKTEKFFIKKRIIRDFFEIQTNITPVELSVETEIKSTVNNSSHPPLYKRQNNNSAHIRKTRIQIFKDIHDQESRRDQICSRRHEDMLFQKELKIYGQDKYIQDVFTNQMKNQIQDKKITIFDQLQTPKLNFTDENKQVDLFNDFTGPQTEIQKLENYQYNLTQNTELKENNPFLYVVVKKIARDKIKTLKGSRVEVFDHSYQEGDNTYQEGEKPYQLDYLQEGLNQRVNGQSSEKIKQNLKQRMKQFSLIQDHSIPNSKSLGLKNINMNDKLENRVQSSYQLPLNQQLQNRFKQNQYNDSITTEKKSETLDKIRNEHSQKQKLQSFQKKKLQSIVCSSSFGYIDNPAKKSIPQESRQYKNFSLNLGAVNKVSLQNQISNLVEQIETLRGENNTTKRKCLQNHRKINNMFQNLSRDHLKLQQSQENVY